MQRYNLERCGVRDRQVVSILYTDAIAYLNVLMLVYISLRRVYGCQYKYRLILRALVMLVHLTIPR